MDLIKNLTVFQNGRIDAYCCDKSIVTIFKNSVHYILSSGIKTKLRFDLIQTGSELAQKILQIFHLYNLYQEDTYFLGRLVPDHEYLTKLNKVVMCDWGTYNASSIIQTRQGYKLSSLQNYASIELNKNLLLVKVEYLQMLSEKEIVKTKSLNYTKSLLQKYKVGYSENSDDNMQMSIVYRYTKISKIFCLTGLPETWYYPCSLLWRYLYQSNIITQHPMFQFSAQIPYHTTKFKQIIDLHKQEDIALPNIPIFRKPTIDSRCRLVLSKNIGTIWFCESGSVGYDNKQAIWIQSNESFHLLFKNSTKSKKMININDIPMTVRFQDYENNVQELLVTMYAYFNHFKNIEYQQQLSNQNKVQELKIINQKFTEQFNLKAYSNQIIKAEFQDRTLITFDPLKKMFTVLTRSGQTIQFVDFDIRFKNYIEILLEFHEEIFNPGLKEWREQSRALLQLQNQNNENMIMILKGKIINSNLLHSKTKCNEHTNSKTSSAYHN